MVAEGAVEGPRRIIFDLETISQHEKATGAKILLQTRILICSKIRSNAIPTRCVFDCPNLGANKDP